MTVSAGTGEQLQSNRVPTVHYMKTTCEWSYLFTMFLMVMDENDGTHDDGALSTRR